MLSKLYTAKWDKNAVVTWLAKEKKLTPDFVTRWRGWLEKIVDDPQACGAQTPPRN
jgi:hypothetical protein